jgi:hypothetical protein
VTKAPTNHYVRYPQGNDDVRGLVNAEGPADARGCRAKVL